jgi:hypothetical protein
MISESPEHRRSPCDTPRLGVDAPVIVAKPKRPQRPDPSSALAEVQNPALNWKVIGQIGVGFLVLWVLAVMAEPMVGWWGVGIAGVLTAVALGFGIYVWRLTRKSNALLDIMKTATDKGSRQAALEQLRAQSGGEGKDALNALAQAQLAAQDDPNEAVRILEAVDIEKAPALVRDDIRANLALLYLMLNRVRDARPLVDEISIDRQPQAKVKAMYAAVVGETWARTGKTQEAFDLLSNYAADGAEHAEFAPLLLRAQVHAFYGVKKRGLATTAMQRLAEHDPMLLASFMQKGVSPELQKAAKSMLSAMGVMPKPQIRRH